MLVMMVHDCVVITVVAIAAVIQVVGDTGMTVAESE